MNSLIWRRLGTVLLLWGLVIILTGVVEGQQLSSISINSTNVVEGNSGTTPAVFTLTMSSASTQTVTVDFSTFPGTATAEVDYFSTSGTVVFTPGTTSQTVQVLVVGDILVEPNETFSLVLSNAVNATLGASTGTALILDDDELRSISIHNASGPEGDTSYQSVGFQVSLSDASGLNVAVDYSTSDGTAKAYTDYFPASGTLQFAPGETNQTVYVLFIPNLLNEPDKTFFVTLTNAVNVVIAASQATGTILNDDPPPAVSVTDASVVEPDTGTVNANFTFSLSAPSGQTVTVAYATADVTATSGADYVPAVGLLTFPSGTTNQTVTVLVKGDLLNEATETFQLNLTAITNATLARRYGIGTIYDNDPVPYLMIGDVSVMEGNSGTTNAVFVVSLSAASGQTVTVNYATTNGTATAGSDYVSGSGTVTFTPGVTTQTIVVPVIGDVLYEPNESFFVNLSSPVHATIARFQAIGTIVNDDPFPAISINDVSLLEGNSGTTNAVFVVSLSGGGSQTVTVNYASANGTATAGSDYVSGLGTVTFGPGVTNQTISVAVNGDLFNEANETFFVNLSGALNATIARNQGVGTIVNDDAVPSLTINDVSLLEGKSGTTNAVFAVSLSAASGQTVTVNYATADGTATAGSDYVSGSGTVTFAPGVTSQTITVSVNGDTVYESDETFTVNLSGAANATISRSQGIGTIRNDDPLPAIRVNDIALLEGNSGTTNPVFTVTLDRASAFGVSVSFSTSDGTAKAGSDYFNTVGSLYFSPGTTNQSVTVLVIGDTINEANETFFLNLTNAVNATIADSQGICTIVNDDPLPAVAISDVSLLEGNSGTTNAVFNLTLSLVSGQTVTVDYSTQNGTSIAPPDYLAASGRVSFTPGVTNQTISVTVNGDLLYEANETFFVNLSNPTNATLARSQAVGTIKNDDTPPVISISDSVVLEPQTGTTNLNFPLLLSASSGLPVSVNYYLVDGTATAGLDYVSASGTITFAAGTTNQTVAVAVKADLIPEPNETFFIRLTNPVNASLMVTQAVGTIVDNGSRTLIFTNTAPIAIPVVDVVSPYPSTLYLSGVPGTISKVTVYLYGLTHDSPSDLDILLVGPAGQNVLLMSDAGGANPITAVNLTFDDSAGSLPGSSQINSGTYHPTDYPPTDAFPTPAPPGPYSTQLSSFGGINPNGTWSLYIYDDTFGGGGSLTGGWSLSITATNLICCSGGSDADLSLTMTDSPDPALTGNPLTYSMVVVNSGPANSTGVTVTNALPAGSTFISASASQGTWNRAGSLVTFALGNISEAAIARMAVTVSPSAPGTLTNAAGVYGNETDLKPINNLATAITPVILAPPYLSISDVSVVQLNLSTTNAVFNVNLSKATNQTINVDYTTVSGTAMAGPDFLPTFGTLTFSPGVTNQTITVVVNGDTLVDPMETFFVTLTNPVNAQISRATGQGTILNNNGVPGTLDHFVWNPVSATQYYSVPFTATIRAVDVNGNLVTGFSGSPGFLGLIGPAGTNSILITEIDTSIDRVEFENVTQLPVDISGWEVSFYDWLMWPDPKIVFPVPNGTIVQPGSLFLCEDNGVYPGLYPHFYLGDNLAWVNDPSTNQVAVLLRNRGGEAVDFMCAVDANAGDISYPLPIPSDQWTTAPISANLDPSQTYQRVGSVDRNGSADWVIAANGIGAQNAGLIIPFAGPGPVGITPVTSGSFIGGSWTGTVTVLGMGTNMYVRADDLDAHVGSSGQFTILPTTDIALSATASASLIAAGQTITLACIVTNNGPFATAGVMLTNYLSGPAAYASGFTTQGSIIQYGTNVVVTIGSLGTNASATITITFTGTSPGFITNTVVLSAALRDYYTNNNSSVIVSKVNFPPVISGISTVTINEDTSTGPINFTVSDQETPAGNLLVSANTSDTNLVSVTNIVLGGSGSARTITLTPRPNRFGSTTNIIGVSDGLGTTSTSFVLNVLPVNDPPVLAPISDRTVDEMTLLTFTNSAVDVDNDPLTFTLGPGAPAGASVHPQTGVFTWTPSETQGPGTNQITMTVTDPSGAFDSRSFTVVVREVNLPPVLPSLPAAVIAELSQLVVTNTPFDPDIPTNTLSLQLINPPAGASIDQRGVVTWTPTEAQGPGNYTITTVITDNGSPIFKATNSFTVTVTEVNTAPLLGVVSHQTVNEMTALVVPNAVTDADVPTNTLSYQLLNPPAGAAINAQGTITWTPSEAQGPGTYTLTTVVMDNGSPSLSATNVFTVTVNEVNQPPVLPSQANRLANELAQLVVNNTATDPDLPGNTLTYQLLAPPVGASIDFNGIITWTPAETQGPGVYTLTTVVTDNGVPPLSATNSFTVKVNEVNTAPVLVAQPDRTIDELSILAVTNAASDADVPANVLSYQLLNPPTGAAINAAGVISWTPNESQGPGSYTLTTLVTDNGIPVLSAVNSFTVTVREVNSPPVLPSQADLSVSELSQMVVVNTAADPDIPANVLTYRLISPPAGAVIDSQGVITWTPSESQGPGSFVITTVATDNGVPPLSVTNSFTVAVTELNSAPVLSAQINRVINELSTLVVSNAATDGDIPANILSYKLLNPPVGATINAQGTIAWIPTEAQGPGTYTLTTLVTDNGVPPLSATNSFTVTVNEVNSPPVLPAQLPRVIDELTVLVVTNAATDVDLPANTLSYQLINPPAGATISAQGTINWTPSEAQGPGTYTLTTIVTDSGSPSLAATNAFTVTVNEVNTAPVLSAQPARSIGELTQLVVNNSAADIDLPPNSLSYQLINAPSGATINAQGLITWIPTEGQGPGVYAITTVVTDNGIPPLSATNAFNVTVTEVNTPPVLPILPNVSVDELSHLVVTNTAVDGDWPPNNLTYQLENPPAGAVISPLGIISWTPTEAQGPGVYTITTAVTDDGIPPASTTNSFTVTVNEVNSSPLLPAQVSRTVNELITLVVTNAASDADLPANTLSYQLLNPPAGASISTQGTIIWTPSETQGPGTYILTTVVTDNGPGPLSATNSFSVTVNEVNSAPTLAPIGEQSVRKTTLLTFTVHATDSDFPVQSISYTLDGGAPAGAAINPVTGVFTWTPTTSQGPSTNFLTIRVTDSGTPALNDFETIQIVVTDSNLPPVLAPIPQQTVNEGSLLTFTATAMDSDVPAQTLTYSLDPGAPSDASINPTTGVFTWTPSEAAGPSTNFVVVRVMDNGNPPATDGQTVTIVVNEVNSAPILPVQADRTVLEMSALTVTNTATDPDIPANSIAYQLMNPPAGASIDQRGVITWTPTEAQGPGVYLLTTVATHNGAPPLSATNTFAVNVKEVNQPPVLSAQTNRTIDEMVTLIVTNAAVDADLPPNLLSYQLINAPAGASIDLKGVILWTPSEAQGPGDYTITTVATDNGIPPLSATNTFEVNVLEVNRPPNLPVQTDRTVDELTQIVITNTATDPDLPANQLAYQLVNPPPGATINAQGLISWIPSESQGPASYDIVTIVTDDGVPSLRATNAFKVIVAEVNSAPILPTQSTRTINELSMMTVQNAATDQDFPANSISYKLLSAPSGVSIDSGGTIIWTPNEAQGPSTYSITTVATDKGTPPLSATNSFTVIVNEVNAAPSLPAQLDRVVDELTSLRVTNTATDPDLPANIITYQLVNPPTGAIVDGSGVIVWTPTEDQGPGTYTITTMATDNGTPALNAINSFVVTVREVNSPPALPVQANRSVVRGTQLVVDNAPTDSDLPVNTLTYQLLNPPVGASVNGEGLIEWVPSVPGSYTIMTKVTDNGAPALSATNSFSVTVVDTNSPPVLGFQPNRVVNEMTALMVTNAATDPDLPRNTLNYALLNPPSGATIDSVGVIRWTPSEAQGPGTYTLTTVVSDGVNPPLSATNSFLVTVTEVNSPPDLSPVPDQALVPGQTLWLTTSATDSDLPANSLSFSLSSGPPGATLTADGIFSWKASSTLVNTTNLVTISVADDGTPTMTDSKSFRIVVVETSALSLAISLQSSGMIGITWNSLPGTTYRVEYMANLDDSIWQTLEDVVAIGAQTIATDEALTDHRFYRVKVLP